MYVIILFVMFNSTPVVMASGRELSYMLLSGCILCYAMTFVLLAKPTAFMCAAQRYGFISKIYQKHFVAINKISRYFASFCIFKFTYDLCYIEPGTWSESQF